MSDCPTCPSRDVTEVHLGRCALITGQRDEAVAHGRNYGVPDVTTADLWAHLGHVASPHDATRIVRQVLDLGWRPVVGNDKKRLARDDEEGLFDAETPVVERDSRSQVHENGGASRYAGTTNTDGPERCANTVARGLPINNLESR